MKIIVSSLAASILVAGVAYADSTAAPEPAQTIEIFSPEASPIPVPEQEVSVEEAKPAPVEIEPATQRTTFVPIPEADASTPVVGEDYTFQLD